MQNLKQWIPRHIQKMHAYVPGLQDSNMIKLNTNENPFPLPEFIKKELHTIIEENTFHLYPDPEASKLREKIAKFYNKNKNQVIIGNGSDDILSIVFRTFLQAGDTILILKPSYSLYPVLCRALQVQCIEVPLQEDFTLNIEQLFQYNQKYNPKLIVITNPNAPTGMEIPKKQILEIYKNIQKPILIDEAYVFFGGESLSREAGSSDFPLLMVCSTFSKAYSLAGLRVGWLIAHHEWIEELDKIRDSYNINGFSQKAAELVLKHIHYFQDQIQKIIQIREWFIHQLEELQFITLPSHTNFVFTSPPNRDGKSLYEFLLKRNILVRFFSQIPEFVRITIGDISQMKIVIKTLKEYP